MLDNELHFLLLRAFNHSNRRIDAAIRAIGLLPGQPKIIECLAERDGRTAKEICAECILDKSTMTGLLKRMEDRGLVRREISETDKRSYRVFLTASGHSYAARIAAIMREADAHATRGMNDAQVADLKDGLRRVIANLERLDTKRTHSGPSMTNNVSPFNASQNTSQEGGMTMPYFIKRLICLLTGLAVESFGIALITKSNLGTSPISSTAGVLSFIFFGRLDGIGVGTVIPAAFTGLIVNFINRHAHFVGPIDPRKPDQAKAQAGAETSIGTRQTERETA